MAAAGAVGGSTVQSYIRVMRKYAVFTGRASRSEYWLFHLILILLSLAASILDLLVFGTEISKHQGPIGGIVLLVHLLPYIALSVRRLHDIDRSGWWLLLDLTGIGALVIFIFAVLPGTHGSNTYGADPLAPAAV